ncbi:hypothetical protein CHS0354_017122 [Potamilus streckersoni]|uniref:Solute carrier family 15 member 4 n=1 Tax=Potamilus streckersoni TaxID=2493646 RepID=A0AAE0VT36_9BIVA|nr:hypothetical protein CHS0354_017122 [Potamilus streckersoni]
MVDERKRLIPQRNDVQEEDNVPFCCCPRFKNRKIAQATVLLTVALERFSFYSLSGNLVLFLTVRSLQWESYNAINASLYFLGISFTTCLFGGWLADAFTGRLRAILLGFVAYLVGYVLLLLLSNRNLYRNGYIICHVNESNAASDIRLPDENCVWQVYITLTIIALGTGVIKANLAPFGADQVRGESSDSSTAFFHWFYWSINVGTLVALTAITYVQQQGDFFSAYLAASICLTVAMLIFFCGKCSYVIRKPAGSVFKNIYKIVREACRIRRRKTRHSSRGNYNTIGTVDVGDHQEPTSFLDHAKFRYGGSFHDSSVENVKVLGKIVCVFLALIPYWMVYFQIETTFLVQGLHMKLSFYSQNNVEVCNNSQLHVMNNSTSDPPFQIVAAWLSLFDVVLLIVILPIMNKVVYPWISRSGYNFTMERRIALGLVFSVFAAFSAGLVENFRLQRLHTNDESTCCYRCINQLIGNSIYCAADMSILYQIPQYTLIGLSEVFTSVAGLEFACSIAPQSLKSIVMGLFYLFSGLGSLLSVGLIYVLMGHWFHDNNLGDINCRCVMPGNKACHLDFYFYTLGGIQILGLVAFVIVIWKCKLRKEIIGISVQDPATRPNPFKVDDETSASTATSAVGVRPRIPVDINRTISQDHSGRLNRLVSDER